MTLPKKVRIARRLGTVGALMLGLGLFALFSDNPGKVYPELANQTFVISLMVVAVLLIAAEYAIKLPYYRQLREEQEDAQPSDDTDTDQK